MHLTPAAAVDLAAAAPQVHGHGAGVYQDQRREGPERRRACCGHQQGHPDPYLDPGQQPRRHCHRTGWQELIGLQRPFEHVGLAELVPGRREQHQRECAHDGAHRDWIGGDPGAHQCATSCSVASPTCRVRTRGLGPILS
jgi:hypothetical protein